MRIFLSVSAAVSYIYCTPSSAHFWAKTQPGSRRGVGLSPGDKRGTAASYSVRTEANRDL